MKMQHWFYKLPILYKIMSVVVLPVILICPVFFYIYADGTNAVKDERNKAMHIGDVIALNGSISRQRPVLEKAVTDVLNTDETAQLLIDPADSTARIILDGLFISLQEQNIVRFTLYNEQFNIILQQTKNLPEYARELPGEMRPLFKQAEEDFEFHYYFRGAGKNEVVSSRLQCSDRHYRR